MVKMSNLAHDVLGVARKHIFFKLMGGTYSDKPNSHFDSRVSSSLPFQKRLKMSPGYKKFEGAIVVGLLIQTRRVLFRGGGCKNMRWK